ncbi:MAG: phospholipase D family protein [Kofleriaceae bacterium]
MSRAPRVARRKRKPLVEVAAQLRAPAKRSALTLDDVTTQLHAPRRPPARSALTLDGVAKQLRDPKPAAPEPTSLIDAVSPARQIAVELISGRGHYERVIAAVTAAHTSVWISTANVKELMVEDHRARPGRNRSMRRKQFVSILALLDELAGRGVELRLLHADLPSGPFRSAIAEHPQLVAGALALRRCPRVHMKAVIVDGELLYLGSANWTGAGLGAKGSGRRNFELGIVTDDGGLLDQVQAIYEQVWSGGECTGCKLRAECPGPLADLAARPTLPERSSLRRPRRPRLI